MNLSKPLKFLCLNCRELIELHKNLSLNYYSLENFRKSIEEAKNILKIENDNEWAIGHLILLYKKENNWKEATDYLKVYFDKLDKDAGLSLFTFAVSEKATPELPISVLKTYSSLTISPIPK